MFAALGGLVKGALSWLGTKAAGASLAKGIGGLAAGAAGNRLGNIFARQAYEDQFGFLRSQGLTPTEIAGGGSSAGTPGNPGATLGNNYTEMARTFIQMQYDADQREKDRQVARDSQAVSLANANTAAQASLGSSSMAANASRYSSDTQRQIAEGQLALSEDRFRNLELPKGLNDIVTSSPDWKRQEILARMGVDNALATVVLSARGIDVMDPQALADLSPKEFQELVIDIYGMQSHIFRETAGSTRIIREGVKDGWSNLKGFLGFKGDEPSPLGNNGGGGTGQPLRIDIPPG